MSNRTLLTGLLAVLCLSAAGAQGGSRMNTMEPNIEIAKTWWDEMEKKWTVVGWPEHRTRFNVMYDGTLVSYFGFHRHPTARKDVRPDIPEPYTQFAFVPAGSLKDVPTTAYNVPADYGDVVQGWADSETPVLWSEWAWHGYLLRSQVFAHVPGGKALTRGDEPLFAWVRLSVHYAAQGLPLEQNVGFGVRINAFSVNGSMEVRHNLNTINAKPKYPRELSPAPSDLSDESDRSDTHIVEPDGRVRMAVVGGKAEFRAGAPTADDSLLFVTLPPKQGSYVDLLIPMLPTERDVFDKELALGYDGALREAEAFWKKKPATTATFQVPEDYINQAIRRNIQQGRISSERYPSGEVYAMTGGFWYGVACWGTPVCLSLSRFLDPLGEHQVVESYLKAFKDAQGRVIPPGDGLKQHPGYLGVPPETAIINWLPDHGAILWAMAEHAMLSGDPKFIEEYTPVIVKACEWVRDARRTTDHDGVKGIMPPAGASDDESHIQNCWTDGWIYKGLSSAVEFLKMTGNPRAAEFEAEAKDYRETFLKAFRAKAKTTPTWTDDKGKVRHMIPFSLSKEQDWQWRFLFYLDTGAMFQVFAGMLDADDPLMRDSVAWHREGPPSKMYRPYGDLSHVPSLRYEMSSWECCYSWNVYHTWQLGDREHFLQALYSQFAGAMSQQTYTVCESRGGLTSNVFWIPGMELARLAVIDDKIEQGELHLLRLCPLAWLGGKGSTFENMPTRFGPVDLRVKLSSAGDQLQVRYSLRSHSSLLSPPSSVLHIPPVPGLKSIALNGKPLKWDGRSKSVEIR